MIVQGMISNGATALRRALAWIFFCAYYPKRQPNQNGTRFYSKRRRDFEAWYPVAPRHSGTE